MIEIVIPKSIEKITQIMCGCGDPGKAWQAVLDALEYAGTDHMKRNYNREWSGAEWFLHYVLDDIELTDHGGSVCGAWLTDAGKEVLAFLRKYGHEWQDSKAYDFVDDQNCHWSGQ